MQLGVPLIDADQIAKQLTQPNKRGSKAIFKHFGGTFFDSNQHLKRDKLKELIFSNTQQRQQLEQILHPLINQEILKKAKKDKISPYILFDIPLLIEHIQDYPFQRIIVVDINPKYQFERLSMRDNMPIKIACNIIKSQVKRQHRLQYATDIIDNNGSLDALSKQVTDLDKKINECLNSTDCSTD